jgi:hypothetical protein
MKDVSSNGIEAEEVFWGNGDESMALKEMPENRQRVYDLEERTAKFGEAIIDFALTIPHGPVTNRLLNECH